MGCASAVMVHVVVAPPRSRFLVHGPKLVLLVFATRHGQRLPQVRDRVTLGVRRGLSHQLDVVNCVPRPHLYLHQAPRSFPDQKASGGSICYKP